MQTVQTNMLVCMHACLYIKGEDVFLFCWGFFCYCCFVILVCFFMLPIICVIQFTCQCQKRLLLLLHHAVHACICMCVCLHSCCCSFQQMLEFPYFNCASAADTKLSTESNWRLHKYKLMANLMYLCTLIPTYIYVHMYIYIYLCVSAFVQLIFCSFCLPINVAVFVVQSFRCLSWALHFRIYIIT